MNKDLKKQLTNEIKYKLLPEFKTIILNKTLCLINKPNNNTKQKDYEDIIKSILTFYYPNFPEKDEKYFKISLRLAHSYLQIKDLGKCEQVLNELKKIPPNNDNIKFISDLNHTYEELKKLKRESKKKTKNLIASFTHNVNEVNTLDEGAFVWDIAIEGPETHSKVEPSIINTLKK
jgi:hypothetical protein